MPVISTAAPSGPWAGVKDKMEISFAGSEGLSTGGSFLQEVMIDKKAINNTKALLVVGWMLRIVKDFGLFLLKG